MSWMPQNEGKDDLTEVTISMARRKESDERYLESDFAYYFHS